MMPMDMKRRAVFALIAAAIIINIAFGIVNDGFPFDLGGKMGESSIVPDETMAVHIPSLRDGDIIGSSCNMSLSMVISDDEGTEGGYYDISGYTTRIVGELTLTSDLKGTYSLSHSLNGTEDISLSGTISRTRTTRINEDGAPESEVTDTTISVHGPKRFGSTSSITSKSKGSSSLRPDLVWMAVMEEADLLTETSGGSVVFDLDLQEAGALIPDITLGWSVVSVREEVDGRYALIHGSTRIGGSGEVAFDIEMKDGVPWPFRMKLTMNGLFNTEEGPADLHLTMGEDLREVSPGTGRELPFLLVEPFGPPFVSGKPDSMMNIPEEGGDTEFRASPREVLDFCMDQSSHLKGMIDQYGPDDLTFVTISYSRNDTTDRLWNWNITIASPPVDGISDTLSLEVSVDGGGIIEQTRFNLVGETMGKGFRYPDPGRHLITLRTFEENLRRSDYADPMFRMDTFSQTFKLDIMSKGDTSSSIGSVLFMNILGVERARTGDLFISRVLDRSDPSRMYVVVMNGGSGNVIQTMNVQGAGVALFNTYGFDLA